MFDYTWLQLFIYYYKHTIVIIRPWSTRNSCNITRFVNVAQNLKTRGPCPWCLDYPNFSEMHNCHLDRIGNSPSHSRLHSASYFHVGRNWVGRVYSLLYRGLVWSGNLPELHSSSYICVSLKKLWAWALNFSSHQVTCPGVEMDWIGPQKLC